MTIAQDNLAKSSALLSGKMAVNIVCSEIRGKKSFWKIFWKCLWSKHSVNEK